MTRKGVGYPPPRTHCGADRDFQGESSDKLPRTIRTEDVSDLFRQGLDFTPFLVDLLRFYSGTVNEPSVLLTKDVNFPVEGPQTEVTFPSSESEWGPGRRKTPGFTAHPGTRRSDPVSLSRTFREARGLPQTSRGRRSTSTLCGPKRNFCLGPVHVTEYGY